VVLLVYSGTSEFLLLCRRHSPVPCIQRNQGSRRCAHRCGNSHRCLPPAKFHASSSCLARGCCEYQIHLELLTASCIYPLYTCIHMYTYVYIYIILQIYMYTCIHIHKYACICIYMHTYTHVCVHIHMYVCIYLYKYMHLHIYSYIYVHM